MCDVQGLLCFGSSGNVSAGVKRDYTRGKRKKKGTKRKQRCPPDVELPVAYVVAGPDVRYPPALEHYVLSDPQPRRRNFLIRFVDRVTSKGRTLRRVVSVTDERVVVGKAGGELCRYVDTSSIKGIVRQWVTNLRGETVERILLNIPLEYDLVFDFIEDPRNSEHGCVEPPNASEFVAEIVRIRDEQQRRGAGSLLPVDKSPWHRAALLPRGAEPGLFERALLDRNRIQDPAHALTVPPCPEPGCCRDLSSGPRRCPAVGDLVFADDAALLRDRFGRPEGFTLPLGEMGLVTEVDVDGDFRVGSLEPLMDIPLIDTSVVRLPDWDGCSDAQEPDKDGCVNEWLFKIGGVVHLHNLPAGADDDDWSAVRDLIRAYCHRSGRMTCVEWLAPEDEPAPEPAPGDDPETLQEGAKKKQADRRGPSVCRVQFIKELGGEHAVADLDKQALLRRPIHQVDEDEGEDSVPPGCVGASVGPGRCVLQAVKRLPPPKEAKKGEKDAPPAYALRQGCHQVRQLVWDGMKLQVNGMDLTIYVRPSDAVSVLGQLRSLKLQTDLISNISAAMVMREVEVVRVPESSEFTELSVRDGNSVVTFRVPDVLGAGPTGVQVDVDGKSYGTAPTLMWEPAWARGEERGWIVAWEAGVRFAVSDPDVGELLAGLRHIASQSQMKRCNIGDHAWVKARRGIPFSELQPGMVVRFFPRELAAESGAGAAGPEPNAADEEESAAPKEEERSRGPYIGDVVSVEEADVSIRWRCHAMGGPPEPLSGRNGLGGRVVSVPEGWWRSGARPQEIYAESWWTFASQWRYADGGRCDGYPRRSAEECPEREPGAAVPPPPYDTGRGIGDVGLGKRRYGPPSSVSTVVVPDLDVPCSPMQRPKSKSPAASSSVGPEEGRSVPASPHFGANAAPSQPAPAPLPERPPAARGFTFREWAGWANDWAAGRRPAPAQGHFGDEVRLQLSGDPAGLVVDETTLQLRDVLDGSRAMAAGLGHCIGRRITHVDGGNVGSAVELAAALRPTADGSSRTVVLGFAVSKRAGRQWDAVDELAALPLAAALEACPELAQRLREAPEADAQWLKQQWGPGAPPELVEALRAHAVELGIIPDPAERPPSLSASERGPRVDHLLPGVQGFVCTPMRAGGRRAGSPARDRPGGRPPQPVPKVQHPPRRDHNIDHIDPQRAGFKRIGGQKAEAEQPEVVPGGGKAGADWNPLAPELPPPAPVFREICNHTRPPEYYKRILTVRPSPRGLVLEVRHPGGAEVEQAIPLREIEDVCHEDSAQGLPQEAVPLRQMGVAMRITLDSGVRRVYLMQTPLERERWIVWLRRQAGPRDAAGPESAARRLAFEE
eukprot:TRINITY_DN20575_c0_g1_i1.p1 TRINITY_DN20575_c0_g1~~TRINITY_DN20575_c0_g1_i1.p1  ORF type:complete len:1342 (+),score=361.23 TRINITY_DN20575_c0_g1_i1:90-4115(+)